MIIEVPFFHLSPVSVWTIINLWIWVPERFKVYSEVTFWYK